MDDDNVIYLHRETPEEAVHTCLGNAADVKLDKVLVLGTLVDGGWYAASTCKDVGWLLTQLERVKFHVMHNDADGTDL